MMAAPGRSGSLVERLPAVRGVYRENVPLSDMTWFRVGGPAEVLFRPADEDDLLHFLLEKPKGLAVTVIGVGSNLLVRDGGIAGVLIRLGRGFSSVDVDGETVRAGAGAANANLALKACQAGLSGFEFLRGVPGTVGGGLRMNCGAYDREMADIVTAARAVDPDGRLHDLGPKELGFAYRHSDVPEDWLFLGAEMRGQASDCESVARHMNEIVREREETQPVRVRTGGSTFKNPEGRKAWELIERAGCRGLSRGGASVSEMHCNFLVNRGDASAGDLESLGEEVRRRVHEATGVTLEWEIRRIGRPGHDGPREVTS